MQHVIAWLFEDWHGLAPAVAAHLLLALAAVASGALVGFERERREKAADISTLTLVSLGAAVFATLSSAVAGPRGDEGRILAQVVTGVGFLGAGAIMRSPLGISGLTTAATVWMMAAVGATIGLGFGGIGLLLAVGVLALLATVPIIERRLFGHCEYRATELSFAADGGKTIVRLEEILDTYRIPKAQRLAVHHEGDIGTLRINYCAVHRHHKELLTRLIAVEGVTAIRRNTDAG